jgi:hypothetical protein
VFCFLVVAGVCGVGLANGGVDFNAANAVVEATHRHKAIFYDGE